MSQQVPEQLYPFATADGKDIPFDILKPQGLAILQYNPSAFSSFTGPAAGGIVTLFSKAACLVSFAEAPTQAVNQYIPEMLYVPANCIVHCEVPAPQFQVIGVESDNLLYVQYVTRWASLAVPRQFNRK